MYVIADIEWVTSRDGRISPVQLAAVRVDEGWNRINSFCSFIKPLDNSFDDWTQENVNLIFSHINAVKRKQFNGKSSYDMFSFTYSEELANALGISFVAPKYVIQTSRLLKLFS